MRGGTSRAIFLKAADLPVDEAERDRVILSIFGSPDRRQIDGIAGADPLTSKLAIIGPPSDAARAAGAHLSYTFGQVEIDHPSIDWHSLCGNISAAVGAFGVYEGMVAVTAPITTVRVFNTNLQRMLTIEVPVEDGRPLEFGDYVVAGVPGSGARILVDFADTAGSATGALLPTGQPVDQLEVPGHGPISASLLDIGNAHVFVRASDVGLTGTESAAEIDQNPKLRALLEQIRLAASRKLIASNAAGFSFGESLATPILGMISAPSDYTVAATGVTVRAADIHVVSRLMFMQQAHKTYAGTSTVCTGVAAKLPGTIVHQLATPQTGPEVRIGHPAGVIETETVLEPTASGAYHVRRATLARTARRILEGSAFVPPVQAKA